MMGILLIDPIPKSNVGDKKDNTSIVTFEFNNANK